MNTMTTETKLILEKLDAIKSELDYIKGHITDVDAVVTTDDIEALRAADDDYKKGRTKRIV